ncbi:SNF2 family N-terminal domain-containing protein [Leptodontidium sp. MPI-SDFR-AT-0119]|nr:SNF2 family N-terminal domain-containing protein [Leptodontidium sp. MPI-SDFR-AT-0119]
MAMMPHCGDSWEDVGFDGNSGIDGRNSKRRRLNPSIPHPGCPPPPKYISTTYNCISVQSLVNTSHSHNASIPPEQSFGLAASVRAGNSSEVNSGDSLPEEPSTLHQECCYGMLPNIRVRLSAGVLESTKHLPVLFESLGTIRLEDSSRPETFQIESPTHISALNQILAAKEISIQPYCSVRTPAPARQQHLKGKRGGRFQQSWTLNVIIYGPQELEGAIGQFLSQQKMYLQDPLHCDRSVPYRNPHIIPPENGEVLMTDSIDSHSANLEIERLEAGPDLLSQLMSDAVPLPETQPSDIVKTALFCHQKQALTFMLRREQGWQMDGPGDIWTSNMDFLGRTRYRNNVSETYQAEPPAPFKGGLLADDMGLGKTLSMISVIASNQIPKSFPSPPMTPEPIDSAGVKTTLLIVPLALIQSWEEQFKLHLRKDSLKVHVFHGQNRKTVDFLTTFDVVITTFHTISSIWRKWKERPSHSKSIFSVIWHRVVLDEAHIIQNSQNHLAQSCCALRSTHRWAITGTPIQNKLSDFASIVTFLQVHPYSDQVTFDEEISKPWRRDDSLGFLRLKTLVRAITIARTKAVVHLPPREDFIHHMNFTSNERQIYEDAKRHTVTLLRNAASSSFETRTTVNALQRLNVLRLICSHGLLSQSYLAMQTPGQSTPCTDTQTPFGNSFSSDTLEELFDGSYSCVQCGSTMIDDLVGGSQRRKQGVPPNSEISLSTLCLECRPQPVHCGFGRQDLAMGDLDIPDSPMSTGLSPTPEVCQDYTIMSMPTKIKELAADLVSHGSNEKSVVFSYWTYTLDLVQTALDDSGIEYARFDGKMSPAKRTQALRSFQRDPSIRVILVSITCGGAGLDLTAASRAYLMEPHWNPMIEEQALCRVHRVGQKRSVTTIRYLMRDSFEEQVVEIQKRKKLLAKVTFGQDPLEESGIGMSTLQYLKSVLE